MRPAPSPKPSAAGRRTVTSAQRREPPKRRLLLANCPHPYRLPGRWVLHSRMRPTRPVTLKRRQGSDRGSQGSGSRLADLGEKSSSHP